MPMTPGPWEQDDNIVRLPDRDGSWVAECYISDDDARAIAALPRLIDAARLVVVSIPSARAGDDLDELRAALEEAGAL